MDTPVWVEALGCGDPNGCTTTTARVSQRAVVRFRLGQTEELPMLLAAACLDVECRADQRCSASTGRCEEATAAQATLRPFQGTDSGLMDAAKVVDASNDLGPDAIDAATADVIADVGVMDLESDAPRPMDGGTRDVSAEDLSLDSASMPQDAPVTQDVEINACADGGIECGDGCRDIRTDVLHCGACNNRCPFGVNASAACISSRCGLSCSDGFGDCATGAALLVQRCPAGIAEGGAGVRVRRLGSPELPHTNPRAAACPRHHTPRLPSIPSPPFTSSSPRCSAA